MSFSRTASSRSGLTPAAGYQSHLAEPVDPPELVTVIASLAGRTRNLIA
jgi:CheY-like chemotaxis protein